jgi:hypothetical protein
VQLALASLKLPRARAFFQKAKQTMTGWIAIAISIIALIFSLPSLVLFVGLIVPPTEHSRPQEARPRSEDGAARIGRAGLPAD